ncbi:MAG: hypothetical protein M3N28_04430 [Actinomycetota bacterium]|nr:hypothetical protein [Actinomycetota bacterium]
MSGQRAANAATAAAAASGRGSGTTSAGPHRGPKTARQEHVLSATLVLLLATVYALAAIVPARAEDRFQRVAPVLFGFDQLEPIGWAAAALPVLAAVALRLPWHRLVGRAEALQAFVEGRSRATRAVLAIGVGVACFGVFFALRNESLNPDGAALAAKFQADVPVKGAHLTHDELLELYVHSRFWAYTNGAFGWSVERSYQFLSSAAGAVFVVVLLAFGRSLLGNRRYPILVLGIASTGFMQLFFGDVENYTLVTTLILLYLFTAHLYIQERTNLLVPTTVLAVAICFHLIAAFLLLSLAYLCLVALRRREWRPILGAGAVLVAVPLVVALYFNHHGLPLESIRTGNAFGQAGNIERFAAPNVSYHGQIVSLLFLLFPPVLLFVPLLMYKRIDLTPFNAFLASAAGAMAMYMFAWKAQLGVYNDWNLYAPAILPLAVLFWYNLACAEGLWNKAGVTAAVVLTSGVHSYAWIVGNHL